MPAVLLSSFSFSMSWCLNVSVIGKYAVVNVIEIDKIGFGVCVYIFLQCECRLKIDRYVGCFYDFMHFFV